MVTAEIQTSQRSVGSQETCEMSPAVSRQLVAGWRKREGLNIRPSTLQLSKALYHPLLLLKKNFTAAQTFSCRILAHVLGIQSQMLHVRVYSYETCLPGLLLLVCNERIPERSVADLLTSR